MCETDGVVFEFGTNGGDRFEIDSMRSFSLGEINWFHIKYQDE